MCEEAPPVDDEEIVYRRIPVSVGFYDAAAGELSPQAFAPHKTRDVTGISVTRGRFQTLEEAGRGRPGKAYFLAVLHVGELRKHGIEVVPQPHLPDGVFDLSHAELPDLRAATRREDRTLELQLLLADELCQSVEGPFETPAES